MDKIASVNRENFMSFLSTNSNDETSIPHSPTSVVVLDIFSPRREVKDKVHFSGESLPIVGSSIPTDGRPHSRRAAVELARKLQSKNQMLFRTRGSVSVRAVLEQPSQM